MSEQAIDPFLKDLQTQALATAEESLGQFREALPTLGTRPEPSLTSAMKACHSLKGNFQAVGFKELSTFVHDLESGIAKVTQVLAGKTIQTQDYQVLEFFLADALQGLESFIDETRKNGIDSAQGRTKRQGLLDMVASWQPSAKVNTIASAATPSAPPALEAPPATASAEPPVVVRKAEPTHALASFLVCKNGLRELAIAIERVVEVFQTKQVNELPAKRNDLLGLLNLRGEVLPIVNLEDTLGQAARDTSYIVVCDSTEGRFGFIVEEANQVLTFDKHKFQPAERLVSGPHAQIVSHFLVRDSAMTLILDVNKVVIRE